MEKTVEWLKSCDKSNIPVSINLAAAELLIVGKTRMEAAEEDNKTINS